MMVAAGGGGLDWWYCGVAFYVGTLRLYCGRWPSFVRFASTFPLGEGSAHAVQIWYHVSFIDHKKAFPEGEGGPAKAGSDEGYVTNIEP